MIRRILPSERERNPPLGENQGLRGGDRGGAHDRPLYANTREVVDDSITIGAEGDGWTREEYTNDKGQKRIRFTRK